jgi:uncharacterized protein (DUF1501 family)
MTSTRRDFLRSSVCGLSAAAFVSSLDRFGALHASTLAASDYRALVCIFLFGGNDANNMVIPYDGYSDYSAVRNSTNALNIAKADLLAISAPSHAMQFGFHPSMPELQSLYHKGKLGVLCNVGTLAQPIVRSQYLAGAPRPDSLFSHADQQSQWQSSIPTTENPLAQTGWGGRTADSTAGLNGSVTFPMIVSVSGVTLFSTGASARPLVPGSGLNGFGGGPASRARRSAFDELLTMDVGKTLIGASSDITSSAADNLTVLNAALAGVAPLETAFPATPLGSELQQIA